MIDNNIKDIRISLEQKDENNLFTSKTPDDLFLAHKIDKNPRYYQINAVFKLNYYLLKGFKRILMILPTGTGKTLLSKLIVMAKDIRKTLGFEDGKKIRVLFIANKHRLLRQAVMEFASCTDIELIPQSAFSNVPQHIIDQGWDITFIDEAHHEAMMSIQKLLEELGNIPIIGFTATPERGDSILIKFEKFIVPISKREAILGGYISEPGINTVIDTGKVDKTKLAISLVKNYKHCMGNTIVFFKTNKECEKFFIWCKNENIPAMWLNAQSTEKELDEGLDQLSKGKIHFLINCKKIDEGIDVLNCTDVILARSFSSKAEKEQLIGRSIRPDSPSVIWEFQNPYLNKVESVNVIGSYKFRRLLYIQNNIWHDNIIEGEDKAWGYGEKLRYEYIKRNLGYDPRIEDEESSIIRKKEQTLEDEKYEIIPKEGFRYSYRDEIDPQDIFKKVCVDSFIGTNKTQETPKITRRIIYNTVSEELKAHVLNCSKSELILIAKDLRKRGLI